MSLPVLLVEDDPLTHAIVRTALAGVGGQGARGDAFALDAVGTLAAALERIERDPPAAVLLDLGLPDSDGLETFRRVRQVAPGLAVVILTATDDDDLGLVAVREGAQDWIVKQQVDPALLPRVVRYAIERRRAEQLLDETADALRAARHQAAVGRLAGGMAHAFNNMLTIIRCGAELMRDQVADGQHRSDLAAMVDAAARASALVKQLLAFSSRQVLRPSPTDLGVLVQGIVPMLARSLGDGIVFTVEAATRLPQVRIDPVQFEQVITDLVLEARDAMPEGGAIRLATSEVELTAPEPHAHGLVTPGRYVVLAVQDDAPIDAEILEHVFEPFVARSGR
ncbi:MAG: response regulator, partial [Gemmatimonadaceae bacterium]|nr:response regulator [Gemmatimonadaceae bacterium]